MVNLLADAEIVVKLLVRRGGKLLTSVELGLAGFVLDELLELLLSLVVKSVHGIHCEVSVWGFARCDEMDVLLWS